MRRSLLGLLLVAACAPKATPTPSPTEHAKPVEPAAVTRETGGLPLDTWANGAVFYEVFVRSFEDSNGDGKGDLGGLIAKLDYLNDGDPKTDTDLGVDALWLMPVFRSPSYHGYDTTDYETINPDYGTNADFERLLAEAHTRGMKVVVDLVLNHTGRDHPWFIESASSPTSPKRDWYVWSPTKLDWGQPWNTSSPTWHEKNGAYYYGIFWAGMPDLNFRTPAVREEAKRIAALWLKRGVDGFRLDATRHLIETGPGAGQNDSAETHAFLKEFAAHVRAVRPDAVLIGENWTDTETIAKYYGSPKALAGGDELPLNFDFPLAGALVDAARSGRAAGELRSKLKEIATTYPDGATDVPFLTNHDMRRLASELGSDPGKLRTAAALLLLLPGTPFLYYGEEVGLENGTESGDEAKRTPMPWDATPKGGFSTAEPWHRFAPGKDKANVAAEANDPKSLLSYYRQLIRVRHGAKALARGRVEVVDGHGSLFAYVSTLGEERVLVVHDLGDAPLHAELPVATAGLEPLLEPPGARAGLDAGRVAVDLPPHGTFVARLR